MRRREEIRTGDTLVLPASVTRQITAGPVDGLLAVVTGRGEAKAFIEGREPVVPASIA